MIQYNKINHKVIKPHDYHIRISFFVHKNCIIKLINSYMEILEFDFDRVI